MAVRGLPSGSLARGRGGFEVRALEKVEKLRPGESPTDPLPCKLLVVSAGIGVRTTASRTTEPLCPAHLAGKEFESGEALHEALGVDDLMRSGGLLATYEMLATPDTAHVPWAEMRQRLIADEYLEPGGTAVAGGFHAIVVAVDGADAGAALRTTAYKLDDDALRRSTDDGKRWALLEGASRQSGVAVLVAAPAWLTAGAATTPQQSTADVAPAGGGGGGGGGGGRCCRRCRASTGRCVCRRRS